MSYYAQLKDDLITARVREIIPARTLDQPRQTSTHVRLLCATPISDHQREQLRKIGVNASFNIHTGKTDISFPLSKVWFAYINGICNIIIGGLIMMLIVNKLS